VHFNVKFPQPGDLSDEDLAALEKILPARPVVDIDPDAHEECSMHDVDMEAEMRRNKGAGRAAYDEDDDEDEMGGAARAVRAAVKKTGRHFLRREPRTTSAVRVRRVGEDTRSSLH